VKKILGVFAILALVLVLSKLANNVPVGPTEGTSFTVKGAHVVACSQNEIVLVDQRQSATRLVKDGSWPDCSSFQANEVVDFFLSRGEKTHFIGIERTAWWRKAM